MSIKAWHHPFLLSPFKATLYTFIHPGPESYLQVCAACILQSCIHNDTGGVREEGWEGGRTI